MTRGSRRRRPSGPRAASAATSGGPTPHAAARRPFGRGNPALQEFHYQSRRTSARDGRRAVQRRRADEARLKALKFTRLHVRRQVDQRAAWIPRASNHRVLSASWRTRHSVTTSAQDHLPRDDAEKPSVPRPTRPPARSARIFMQRHVETSVHRRRAGVSLDGRMTPSRAAMSPRSQTPPGASAAAASSTSCSGFGASWSTS